MGNHFVKIDMATAQPVEDVRINSYGFDLGNPNYIKYSTEELIFTLIGGVNLQQHHRLYLTLKVEKKSPLETFISHRGNLDLYVQDQVKNYARQAAATLGIHQTKLDAALARLTERAEQYRADQSQKMAVDRSPSPMNGQERRDAMSILESDNLIECIEGLIVESGVVAEQQNALRLFILLQTRHFNSPVHALFTGNHFIAKILLETLGRTLPSNQIHTASSISENALYYPPFPSYWKNKVLHLKYLDRQMKGLRALREFVEYGQLDKLVTQKDHYTKLNTQQHKVVLGPILLMGYTAQERLYEQVLNDAFFLECNTIESQRAFLSYQNRQAAGLVNEKAECSATDSLSHINRLIEPVRVVNPYQMALLLPENSVRALRTNRQLIVFIHAITLLHQHQLEKKKDTYGAYYIESTLEHIEMALELLKPILLEKSDELSLSTRQFLEDLKGHLKRRFPLDFQAQLFRIPPLIAPLKTSKSAIQRKMTQLEDHAFIEKVKHDRKNGHQYRICNWEEYDALERGVERLERGLQDLK